MWDQALYLGGEKALGLFPAEEEAEGTALSV